MKRPDISNSRPDTGDGKRAAPIHSLSISNDTTQRRTLTAAERQALAGKVVLRAVPQPMAAITQPLPPIRSDTVTAPLLASVEPSSRSPGVRRT
jgi:hypothetical protein